MGQEVDFNDDEPPRSYLPRGGSRGDFVDGALAYSSFRDRWRAATPSERKLMHEASRLRSSRDAWRIAAIFLLVCLIAVQL